MLRGCTVGPKKKVLLLRKSVKSPTYRFAQEKVNIKFIDTSSKMGSGRFQTADEKQKFYGPKKEEKAEKKEKRGIKA